MFMKVFYSFLILITCLILPFDLLSQDVYKSIKYGYSIELPKGYKIWAAIGEHIDLKAVDKLGNSVIVLIKKLPKEASSITVDDILQTPNEQWELVLNEFLPNPHILKKGKTSVDGKNAYYLHYTSQKSKEPKLYGIEYCIFYNGLQYTITFSCEDYATDANSPYFMRALRSFKF